MFLIARSILVWHPQHVKPSIADMLQPSMKALKHIVVDIDRVVAADDDPLFDIPSEFEPLRTCALKMSLKLSPSRFIWKQGAAEETTGVGLTKYSQLLGGFR